MTTIISTSMYNPDQIAIFPIMVSVGDLFFIRIQDNLILISYKFSTQAFVPASVSHRKFNLINSSDFECALATTDWGLVYAGGSQDSKICLFNSIIISILNKPAPQRKYLPTSTFSNSLDLSI